MTKQISVAKHWHSEFLTRLPEDGDLVTYERFWKGIRVREVRVDAYCHSGPHRRMAQKNRNAQLGDDGAAHSILAKGESLRRGTPIAMLANFESVSFWDRAILLQQTVTNYTVLLTDWWIEIHQSFSSIRLLPWKLTRMVPWARKIRLPGVRDQADQALRHHVAQLTMLRRSRYLVNIDPSPGEAMTARLLLDRRPEKFPRGMGAHWLEMGYFVPE